MRRLSLFSWAVVGLAVLLAGRHEALAQASEQGWVGAGAAPQYFAVLVADVDRAVKWYRMAFGLRVLDDSEAEDGAWRIVNLVSEQLLVEIIRDRRARDVDRPLGFFKVGFQVPDVEVVAALVERDTGERPRIINDTRHKLRILQLRDPEGNLIQLSSEGRRVEARPPSHVAPDIATLQTAPINMPGPLGLRKPAGAHTQTKNHPRLQR